MCVYIYIYIHTYIHIYIYIYMIAGISVILHFRLDLCARVLCWRLIDCHGHGSAKVRA